jgi:valyl-tRNA synthetase
VRFADERIEMSRNFCNKIFNAARFVLLGVEEVDPQPSNATLVDRWIESRLQATAAEANRLIDGFEFAEATKLLYRFVWNEFCDWYVEIAKIRLYGDDIEEKREVSAHLLHLLDDILRLLHPFIPFLTEELSDSMPGERDYLIRATYPVGDEKSLDKQAESDMELLMETVVSLRTLRNELQVSPKKAAEAWLVTDQESVKTVVQDNAALIESLSNTKLIESVTDESQAGEAGLKTAVALFSGGKMLIPLEDLIDFEQEKNRLTAALAKKEQELSRVEGKLANENFVAKAPAELVEKEQAKLDALKHDMEELEKQFGRYFGSQA